MDQIREHKYYKGTLCYDKSFNNKETAIFHCFYCASSFGNGPNSWRSESTFAKVINAISRNRLSAIWLSGRHSTSSVLIRSTGGGGAWQRWVTQAGPNPRTLSHRSNEWSTDATGKGTIRQKGGSIKYLFWWSAFSRVFSSDKIFQIEFPVTIPNSMIRPLLPSWFANVTPTSLPHSKACIEHARTFLSVRKGRSPIPRSLVRSEVPITACLNRRAWERTLSCSSSLRLRIPLTSNVIRDVNYPSTL